VARELQARGLATPAQLANMTETERQLLFSTAAGVISRAGEPDTRLPGDAARPVVSLEALPVLYCPMCSYRIEQFTSAPPITGQCETCGTKLVVRRDASRLLLTVFPPNARHDLRT
jgi:DNA-directed RNA polymerase subunit RPC12/RpoP